MVASIASRSESVTDVYVLTRNPASEAGEGRGGRGPVHQLLEGARGEDIVVGEDAASHRGQSGISKCSRDVADDIGMHESTVSRVVNNKYMHTPQGVFEMKFFFHSGISSSYGESVSSVTIKQRIRKIIESEDGRKPLSDSKIVSILQAEGLILARRTIAKYREELKIPTSNQRKILY